MEFPITTKIAKRYGYKEGKGWKMWVHRWADSNINLLEDALDGWITNNFKNCLNPKGVIYSNIIYLLQRSRDNSYVMFIPTGDSEITTALKQQVYGYFCNLKVLQLKNTYPHTYPPTLKLGIRFWGDDSFSINAGVKPFGFFTSNSQGLPYNHPPFNSPLGYTIVGYYKPSEGVQFMNWTNNPLEGSN